MLSSPTLKRPSSPTSRSNLENSINKRYNHADAYRSPQERTAMKLRVKKLWKILRSAVHSGTAGWLAKCAAESGAAEKPISAASINEIELPQFGVGDTLPLPSGTIPFVSVARFLRNHLSTLMATASTTANNKSASAGSNNNSKKPGRDNNNRNNGSTNLSSSKNNSDSANGGSGSANLIRDNFTEERRRTSACKLILSQHGIGVLTSAFWFMVLRRFRWSIYGENNNHQPVNNGNEAGDDSSSGTFGQVMQSHGDFDQSITSYSNGNNNNNNNNISSISSLPPPSPFAKSKRPTSALVRSFHTRDQLAASKNNNKPESSSVGGGQNANNLSSSSVRASSSSFRTRAALPTMRSADEVGESKDKIIQYAQGLVFNAAFHFGQIYAKHGSEMRNPAILRIFSQMFSSALLNLLVTEFYDAWTEDEMQAKKRRDHLEQNKRQPGESSSSSEDEEEEDEESDETKYKEGENGETHGKLKKSRRNSAKKIDDSQNENDDENESEKNSNKKEDDRKKKKAAKKFKKEKLSNIFNSASSSEEMCLEDHVTELCMSWFYGDQATDALAAAFKPKQESQIAPPVRSLLLSNNNTNTINTKSESSNARNIPTSAIPLPSSPTSSPNKPLGLRRKKVNAVDDSTNSKKPYDELLGTIMTNNNYINSISNINNNSFSQQQQQPLRTVFSAAGHVVPNRHNLELFLRKAKIVDDFVMNQDQQNNVNDSNFDVLSGTNVSFIISSSDTNQNNNNNNDGEYDNKTNNSEQQIVVLPMKFESRRDFELIAQQRKSLHLQEQYKKNHPNPASSNNNYNNSQQQNNNENENDQSTTNNNKNNNNRGNSVISFSDNETAAMHACNATLTQAALAIGKRPTVTDNMEELLHVKDDGTHYSKNSEKDRVAAMLKKRSNFFERNARHLDYCRSRLTVTGVSVDDLDRDMPFSVTQRSQLLELGEVLANFHLSNMIGAKLSTKSEETAKLMASFSSASSTLKSPSRNITFLNNSNDSSLGSTLALPLHQKMSLTNAFTPRPEASLQLNYKDTLRQAGLDTSSFSAKKPAIRCPFCSSEPHKLSLDVSAMKMGGYAQKQAFRCKCCGLSKAGIVPTMVCNRCRSSLCSDCVKVSEAPVVENVLSRAAMAAATKSYGALVGQLWGEEIAGACFGPVHPSKSLPPKKATLEDLGVALATGRNLFTTEQSQQHIVELQHMMGVAAPSTTAVVEKGLVVPSTMTREQLMIQQRRPLSSVGVVVAKGSSRQTLVATPCSKIATPTTDVHIVNNNNNNNSTKNSTTSASPSLFQQHHFYKNYSSGQDADIFKDQKMMSRPGSAMTVASSSSSFFGERHRLKSKRLPPLPSRQTQNNASKNTGNLSLLQTVDQHHTMIETGGKHKTDDFTNTFSEMNNSNNNTDPNFIVQQQEQEFQLLKQREEEEQRMKAMMDKVGYKYHQGGFSKEYYSNVEKTNESQKSSLDETSQLFNLTATKFISINEEDDNNSNSLQQQQQQQDKKNDISSSTPTKQHNDSTTSKQAQTKPPKCAHCTWISNPGLQGRVMRTGCRIDGEVFAATDPVEQHASSIGYGWRNRHLVKMTRVPELDKGNLGRLRSHIHRSLAQARRAVEKADADTERERVASALHGRRLREASSRDMIRQFRQEAEAQATRLTGGAIDEGYHKRQIANAIEKYANKFCAGATSTVMLMMSVQGATSAKDEPNNNNNNDDDFAKEESGSFDDANNDNEFINQQRRKSSSIVSANGGVTVSQAAVDRVALAHKMLDDIGGHPSLGQLSSKARGQIVDFVVHEKASIVKAQTAAGKLKDLLAWSKRQGDEVSMEELVADLDIDPVEIGLAMNASGSAMNQNLVMNATPQKQRRSTFVAFTSLTPPPVSAKMKSEYGGLPDLVHGYHSPTLPKSNLNPFTNYKAFGDDEQQPQNHESNLQPSSGVLFSVEKAKEHSQRRQSNIEMAELAAAAEQDEKQKEKIIRASISAVSRRRSSLEFNNGNNEDGDDDHNKKNDDDDSESNLENRHAEDEELARKTANFAVRRRTIAETVEKRMQELFADSSNDNNTNSDSKQQVDQNMGISRPRKSSINADEIVERTMEEIEEDAKAQQLLMNL